MTTTTQSIEQLAINTIRTLSMDGVQRANSGHPGTPMALAPVSYVLWNRHLKFDPQSPHWMARDRFVLSCGHASMLLYSLLHLAGVRRVDDAGNVTEELAIRLEDLQRFRQWHSPCAGHPEYGEAAGIETTTGPLGQGIGNSVGMAVAAKWMAQRYNRDALTLFGNDVYALCSDGDIMEGIGCEAASLAGHLKLDNLCWIYDDNRITIEGDTDLSFSENVAMRFQGLGWNTVMVNDANDLEAIDHAFDEFHKTQGRPTLILLRSIIGWGSPNKANSHDAHGSPLGEEEVKATKAVYGWPEDETFHVPDEVRQNFADALGRRGAAAHASYQEQWAKYRSAHPELAAEVTAIAEGRLPAGWDAALPTFDSDTAAATRGSSGKVLNAVAAKIPWLLGGSADLAPSTKTLLSGEEHFGPTNHGGRNFHFGIREHAMAACANGMALCGLRPYVATFFVFSDYLRPSMRLSALMRQPVLYVFTHDSIGLGEDGPTHQPVEHLAACRSIPGLVVLRPGDANEVSAAYRAALEEQGRPTALVLTRQNLPTLCRDQFASADGVLKGAYVLADAPSGTPDLLLIGTGSELEICVDAYERLVAQGRQPRVVSFPSWELFEDQSEEYQASVLPPEVTARIVVEAGIRQGWERYLGSQGVFIGMRGFGASAPYEQLYREFGITADAVVEAAQGMPPA